MIFKMQLISQGFSKKSPLSASIFNLIRFWLKVFKSAWFKEGCKQTYIWLLANNENSIATESMQYLT